MDYSEFERYYHEYKHKIFAYLYFRSGRNTTLAEDLTGDVFLKALEKLESYHEERNFLSWIYGIAHNHLVDHFRKERGSTPIETVENTLASDIRAEESLERRLAGEQVAELLECLSDAEREAVLLRYHQDLSMKEIAKVCGESEGNIRVMIHRAIQKMNAKAALLFGCVVLLIFTL